MGNCRLFITNRSFRESYGNMGPILFWLNLDSKAEVDELFALWKAAHAKIVSEPEDKPWKLREFMAADLDGNLIRVFYDFRGDNKRTTHRAKSSSVYRFTRITGRPDAEDSLRLADDPPRNFTSYENAVLANRRRKKTGDPRSAPPSIFYGRLAHDSSDRTSVL